MLERLNDRLDRWEKDHPVQFIFVSVPLLGAGVYVMTWLPVLWEIFR